jgi:hypothetical protein
MNRRARMRAYSMMAGGGLAGGLMVKARLHDNNPSASRCESGRRPRREGALLRLSFGFSKAVIPEPLGTISRSPPARP